MADDQHTTGNDPIEGVDPGGTRSTKPGQAEETVPASAKSTDQTVTSGDRNSKNKP